VLRGSTRQQAKWAILAALPRRLSLSLSLSVLTAIFPGQPGLAGFIEVLTMEVVVTTGAIRRAKFTSNHHHQQSNIQCFTDRMPFLSPNQQCQSTEGRRLDTKIYWSLTALTPWYSSWCFEAFLRSKSLLSHWLDLLYSSTMTKEETHEDMCVKYRILTTCLHCALASGAVYCNRSCLCVCVFATGGRAVSEP